MNSGRSFALNKLFWFIAVFVLGFAYVSVDFFFEGDFGACAITGAVALFLAVPYMIFCPFAYIFDNSGVSICYLLLPNERYLWKNIYNIYVDSHSMQNFLDLIFGQFFKIEGKSVGKNRFYMHGEINKGFYTKRLLEKYWDGKIEGLFFQDVKDRLKRCKAEKQAAFSTDEVALSERNLKANVKSVLKDLRTDMRQRNIEIISEFLYITEDGRKLHSRPAPRYTYTLSLEVFRVGKTDDIYNEYIDLLYVRYGRKSYRCAENKDAVEKIRTTVYEISELIHRY